MPTALGPVGGARKMRASSHIGGARASAKRQYAPTSAPPRRIHAPHDAKNVTLSPKSACFCKLKIFYT
jgi:hypothetical protein